MGKLVKKSELIALGTFGIIFFSYTHFPAILSTLDATTSPDTYTAAATAAYTPTNDYVTPQPVAPEPTAVEQTAVTVTTTNTDTQEVSATAIDTATTTPDLVPSYNTDTTDTPPAQQ